MAQSRDLSVIAATAGTTQTQAGGTVINGDVCLVTTANASDAVTLPANLPKGTLVHLVNLSAAAGLLYPPVGGAINGGSVDASVAIAASISLLIYVTASGSSSTYRAVKTAAL